MYRFAGLLCEAAAVVMFMSSLLLNFASMNTFLCTAIWSVVYSSYKANAKRHPPHDDGLELHLLLSDEIAEMKRKFKTIMHSIEQLKEEVKEKDETLKSEAADYERKKKDCVRGKESAARAKRKQHNLTALAELENEEIKKLEHRILEFESVGGIFRDGDAFFDGFWGKRGWEVQC